MKTRIHVYRSYDPIDTISGPYCGSVAPNPSIIPDKFIVTTGKSGNDSLYTWEMGEVIPEDVSKYIDIVTHVHEMCANSTERNFEAVRMGIYDLVQFVYVEREEVSDEG